jgi:hypothetical protein
MYPRAKAASVVVGLEPGTKVRNPSANTEGYVKAKRYNDVVVRVTKTMIRSMGARDFVEDEFTGEYDVIYDPRFLVELD